MDSNVSMSSVIWMYTCMKETSVVDSGKHAREREEERERGREGGREGEDVLNASSEGWLQSF